jgi:hypothetical protein
MISLSVSVHGKRLLFVTADVTNGQTPMALGVDQIFFVLARIIPGKKRSVLATPIIRSQTSLSLLVSSHY